MNREEVTPELKERARACKTVDELLELAKQEGIELSDDELEGISGGAVLTCRKDSPCDSYGDEPGIKRDKVKDFFDWVFGNDGPHYI